MGEVVRIQTGGLGELSARKALDLLTDDANASFVGGIEFEDPGAVERRTEEGFGEGEDCGCFTGTWGPVEEHVRKLVRVRCCLFVA